MFYLHVLYRIAAGAATPESAGLWLRTVGNNPDPQEREQRFGAPPPGDWGNIDCDPIATALRTMRISRILTLNYDVQFERALLGRVGADLDAQSLPFKILCDEKPTSRDDPRRVTIESGRRRAALSATLDPTSVGQMIAFAAFPRAYDAQVFHLHGRLDDPENMVLTQKDYQRVYLGDETAEKTFAEAQEVMFGGNDILLLGIGMNEEDVLRPFRRFVSRGLAPEQSPRSLFALMPRSHRKRDVDKERDLLTAVRHNVNYDAYVIRYGDANYVETMRGLESIDKPLADVEKALGKGEPISEAHADLQSKIEACLKPDPQGGYGGGCHSAKLRLRLQAM